MLTFAEQSLFNEFVQGLNILLINDFCQYSESIGFYHIILSLLDIFAQTWNHDENLIFIYFELLKREAC